MNKIEVHNNIKNMSTKERIELIFRWHNSIVIERVLSIAADSNYKFDNSIEGNLKFTDGERSVEVSTNGEIVEVNDDRLNIDELRSIVDERLNRTNEMLAKMGVI
mgnify:FL=1